CTTALSQLTSLETLALQAHVHSHTNAVHDARQNELAELRKQMWTSWRDQPSSLRGVDVDAHLFQKYAGVDDVEGVWKAVRDYEEREIHLEDEEVARRFFEELRDGWCEGGDGWVEGSDEAKAWGERHRPAVIPSKRYSKSSRPSTPFVPRAAMPRPQTSSSKRLEKELAEQAALDYALCKQGFPANPVPASTTMPKYATVMATRATKAQGMREAAARAAKETVKSHGLLIERMPPRTVSPSAGQRARTSKMVEMAAEEGRSRRARLLENEERIGMTPEHRFQPEINHTVPDFAALQAAYIEELDLKKRSVLPTKIRPFPGVEEHHTQPRRKHVCQVQTKKKPAEPSSSPAKNPGARPIDATHARDTNSSLLRERHRRKMEAARLSSQHDQESLSASRVDQRKKLQSQIRAHLTVSAATDATAETVDSRRATFQAHARSRAREYGETLREMRKRVSARPCLFEVAAIEGAKKKALDSFEEILRGNGLESSDFGGRGGGETSRLKPWRITA
ncbi:hypothetical protein HKX48_000571, partial [Thoreauomyces humboldtii]